jgi:hypothetical protein
LCENRLGSYGRGGGKKTAKSYAAVRHEMSREQKISAALRPEGGTSCAGLSRFVRIISPAQPEGKGPRQ